MDRPALGQKRQSAVGVLADAAEKTGLPTDCFEVHEISRDEYERLKEA
jgi:hypothetical protein